DGWRGFMIAHTAASYALYKRMRYYEMVNNPKSVADATDQLRRHYLD
ncbi:MAG: glycosyltransferase family 2 protein, partial [Rhodanobacter sp.]